MKFSELEKKLKEAGCYKLVEAKRHEKWFSPITGKSFMIGRHKGQEVATGTLRAILRDAGLE